MYLFLKEGRMIYIPIGLDCSAATFLNENKLRLYSLPFDWTVTYNGVSDIIKDRFLSYIPMDNEKYSGNTYFMHHTFPIDTEKMNRRIERFHNCLNLKTDELVFIRKGHSRRHHQEASNRNCIIKDDLMDAEELNNYLIENYPNLKFKILVFIFCVDCFNEEQLNNYEYKNIKVFNLATTNLDEEYKSFSECMTKIISSVSK